ncbi:MAG: bifunctional (p)ppGpp synthetase/guanosine-3',5'-bis(diphosphate) 3'-pyrophosphohydrolase [Pseudomonadota bacterium]
MMRQYELVERVLSYHPDADEALLNRAYVYAMKAHGQQTRKSGDPYFSHPLEVAAILTELRLDDATIATALLHDVIEDTPTTRTEIDEMFGAEIGALVDGLTKIRRLDLVSKQAEQAENFRKLLVAISSDIRVLLVKLADRLHNMRTMQHMKPDSRKRISLETIEIYAPLAGRMGMQALRDELEDHAFKWLEPEAYRTVTERLDAIREKNKGLVDEICEILDAKLTQKGMFANVSGREKRPYSVWRKMVTKQISLEQFSDIFAFRLVVDTIEDCYRVLGIIHQEWKTIPGRFKDYISTPKRNGYRSIHTTVAGPRYQRVELQIRTHHMHDVAEYGVAAHAIYKDDAASLDEARVHLKNGSLDHAAPYAGLRKMVGSLLEGADAQEVLEHTKLELFQDQVFCFTPKGLLIALPRGATVLDFAYAVHTDIGNRAVGASVNGRHMPVDTRLRNGDEVEVLTSETHSPPPAWEAFVITGRARSAIRKAARDAVRKQFGGLGRHLLSQALEAEGYAFDGALLQEALPRLGNTLHSVDDVMAKVARNELPVSDVVRAMFPDAKLATKAPAKRPKNRHAHVQGQEGWFSLGRERHVKFRRSDEGENASQQPIGPALPIRGTQSDLPVCFAEGGALPGDRIVGVLTQDEGIRIFQIHSPKLKAYEHENWIDVAWDVDPANPVRFSARITVTTRNEPGTLAQIAQLIGARDGNIDSLKMINRGPEFTEMYLDVEVWDLDHLNQIIMSLRADSVVSRVERVFD